MERMAFMSKYLKSFNDITNKLNSLFESSENMRAYEIIPYIINGYLLKNCFLLDSDDAITSCRSWLWQTHGHCLATLRAWLLRLSSDCSALV